MKNSKNITSANFAIINAVTDTSGKPCYVIDLKGKYLTKEDFSTLVNGRFVYGAKIDGQYRPLCISKKSITEAELNSLLLTFKPTDQKPTSKKQVEKTSLKSAKKVDSHKAEIDAMKQAMIDMQKSFELLLSTKK